MTKIISLTTILIMVLFSCKNRAGKTLSPEITSEQIENYYDAFYILQEDISKGNFNFIDKGYPFRKANQEDMVSFYRIVGNVPVWLNEDGMNIHTWNFLEELKNADSHGLIPEEYFYNLPIIPNYATDKTVFNHLDPDQLIELEYGLSWAYITLQKHLSNGRINPDTTAALWKQRINDTLVTSAIGNAFNSEDISGSLDFFAPQSKEYKALQQALVQYRKIEEEGGWPVINTEISEKDSSIFWAQLAQRLQITGEYPSESNPLDTSEQNFLEIKEAIQKYQERMGLGMDGKAGKETLAQLNQPVEYRIKQLVLNLERLRWEPRSYGEEYVLINIPEFKLRAYRKSKKKLEMKVIVGRYMTKTPIFSDTIEYVVFNPTWTLPMSIMKNEMLPKLRRGTGFMYKDNYTLYSGFSSNAVKLDPSSINWDSVKAEKWSYRIVQEPGNINALGSVKFIFPNDMDIYLHDTPAPYLFERTERDFSHGCMRIQKPREFAEFLLDDKLNSEEIDEIFASKQTHTVNLPQRFPVYITYHTAWVEDDVVHFRKDLYGHDDRQYKAIIPTYDRVAQN